MTLKVFAQYPWLRCWGSWIVLISLISRITSLTVTLHHYTMMLHRMFQNSATFCDLSCFYTYLCINRLHINIILILFRMGLFGDAHGCGRQGQKALPKEDPKIHEPRDTTHAFFWHHRFFIGNQQILLYQQTNACWYNISNSFNFFWVFKNFSIKMVAILIKIVAYCRLAWNKGILKKSSWLHNFSPWRHQPNFITWLKLYCICGHGIKVW